jgi:hypothetical protein
MRRIPMTMQDWIVKLEGFLSLNDRDILKHAGTISHELAIKKAEQEYDVFHQKRLTEEARRESDFDGMVKAIESQDKKKLSGGKSDEEE